MKKIIYILSLVICFSCASVQAQNYISHKVKSGETVESIAKQYNVTKSDILKLNPDTRRKLKPNKVLIIPKRKDVKDNTVTTVTKELTGYKKHKTKRKETLYSLSKKYNVTEDDIKKYNKFLYANNLRKGDRLQIPIFKTVTKVEEKATTKTYTVLPKEGKWRIAYKFGITVDELAALNPDMGEVIQPGQLINVPNLDTTEEKSVEEEYSYYTVLPKEGFYRLKIKLELTKEELERLNPGLAESGLKEGMILKVPFDATIEAKNLGVEGELLTGTGLAVSDLANQVLLRDSTIIATTKNIAIMLPFKLNKIDTDSVLDTKSFIKKDRALSISLDFYSGALFALDSLKKLGVNLKVDVYDTKNMRSEITSIIRNNNFDDTHAVIGPLMPKNFNEAASVLRSKDAMIISPITKKVNLGSNVFQTRPTDEVLKEKLISHFKADTTSHFIIISDSKNKAITESLKKQFPKAAIVSSRVDFKTKKEAYNIIDKDVIDILKPGNNVVFLETQNAGLVSNVTSILNSLSTKESKIILTTTNQNKAFENEEVQNSHLSKLNFTYASISKIVDEDSKNSFVKAYKKEYDVTPNAYAVRGFDVTMDIVLRLVTSESLKRSVNDAPLTNYVENKFAYKKKLFGGYYNDTAYLIQYKDLKIVELKQ